MAYSPKLLLTARNEQHITQNKKYNRSTYHGYSQRDIKSLFEFLPSFSNSIEEKLNS